MASQKFRERRARERARDFGCYFCVHCEEPIRGLVCYRKGSACHFGCQEDTAGGWLTLERLEECQEAALKNVRDATMALHHEALPRLRTRMARMGFKPEDADTTLNWIRDEAPIIIHVDLAAFGSRLAADTHYRNQFETDTSRGCLSHKTRTRWEADLFGDAYSGARAADRCKYGVLNVTNDPQGIRACSNYGTSYLLLRNVRLRTTFAARDSGGIGIAELATVDYYAHVLEKYSDDELKAAVEVGTRRTFGRDSAVIVQYKEAQIHGEVNLAENVELIMAHPSLRTDSHREMLRRLSERCQAQVVWIESSGHSGHRPTELTEPDDTFTSPAVRSGGTTLPSRIGSTREDEEMALAMAASRADAAETSTIAESIAAEEARDLAEALKLSSGPRGEVGMTAVDACTPTHAESDPDPDIAQAMKASLSEANEDWIRRVSKRQRDRELEEEEVAKAIQASLAAAEETPWHPDATVEGFPSATDVDAGGCGDGFTGVSKAALRLPEGSLAAQHTAPDKVEQARALEASIEACTDPAEAGNQGGDRTPQALVEAAKNASRPTPMDAEAQEERRVDPTLDNNAVTFVGMLEGHRHQGLTEDQLKEHWTKLEKVDSHEACAGYAAEEASTIAKSLLSPTPCEPEKVEHVLKASLRDDTRRLLASWRSDAAPKEVLAAISKAVLEGFNFKTAKEFVMKYKDEDGDMLTLVDSTVHDLLNMQHGPLKITVDILGESTAAVVENDQQWCEKDTAGPETV